MCYRPLFLGADKGLKSLLCIHRLHHDARVVQLVARSHIILLLQFSNQTAKAVLVEVHRVLSLANNSTMAPAQDEEDAAVEPGALDAPPGLNRGVLLGKFSLLVLAAALAGSETGSSQMELLRSFLWRLVCPTGRMQDLHVRASSDLSVSVMEITNPVYQT